MTKTTEEFKQTHEDNNNNKTNHLTQDQKDEYKLRQERVVRWDKYRIELMSFSYNFFIGLSLTFLGFFIAQTGLVLYKSCLFVISNFVCTFFGNIICTEIGNMRCT